jgi:hypothetical protein
LHFGTDRITTYFKGGTGLDDPALFDLKPIFKMLLEVW